MKIFSNNHGFTLIELMMVIAILAILATFALPAYGDYTKRTYVSEGLALAQGAQSAVTEYYASQGRFPTGLMNSTIGLAGPTKINGQGTKSILVTAPSNIPLVTIAYNSKVRDNATLGLTMDTTNAGSYQWICGYAPTQGTNVLDSASKATTLPSQWLPSNCRAT